MEQVEFKGFVKCILDSNAITTNLIMTATQNYSIHKYFLSLLPLNELDKKAKNLWLERTRKIKVSSDDAKINCINNSENLKDGKLTMHNGIMIYSLSYYGTPVMRMLMENNAIHEPQKEILFQEVLKSIQENATMLELGCCYWGFYSMWFASKVKDSKIFLIDNHDGIARAKANFKMKGLKAEFMTGYIGKDNPESPMTITNVDKMRKDKSISFIDFLNSDIQGFELEMLETAPEMSTKRAIGFIFISTHSQELHYNCIDFLKQNGYIIICDTDLEDFFSEDGLIVARDPVFKGPDSFTISSRKKEDLPA
jgi:hypothetical protein